MIVEFPDTKTEKLIEQAMEELGNWVESQLELGVSPIILICLIKHFLSRLNASACI